MLTPVPFYFLRHGQTDWNLAQRIRGRQDIPLNDTGRRQAQEVVPALRHLGIASISCSPLLRARESASIIADMLNLPITIIDDLQEANWGVCEGRPKDTWFTRWREGVTPEGAETYPLFLQRALRGVNTALTGTGPQLIVAHGGTYWAVEQQTRITLDDDIPNCSPLAHSPPTEQRPYWFVEAI